MNIGLRISINAEPLARGALRRIRQESNMSKKIAVGGKSVTQEAIEALAKSEPKTPLAVVHKAADEAKMAVVRLADLLSKDVSPGIVASVHQLVTKEILKPLEDMKKFTRDALKALVEEHGEAEELHPNTKLAAINYGKTNFQAKASTQYFRDPDPDALKVLAEELDLNYQTDLCTKTVSYDPSREKLEALLKAKKITEDQFKACFRVKQVNVTLEKL